jgi:hypothetical protein
MTGRPDIDGHRALTTDATVAIDGNEWAVDHCLVSREPDLPPAMAQAEKALSSRLQAIAEAHKCGLAVSYLPQARSGHSRQEIEDYYNEVTATVEAAAKSEEISVGNDGFITVQVYPADPPEAVLIPFTDTTGTPFLGTQLEAGLTAPLTKKLTGQLKNAKDAGWPVILLLDQPPPWEREQDHLARVLVHHRAGRAAAAEPPPRHRGPGMAEADTDGSHLPGTASPPAHRVVPRPPVASGTEPFGITRRASGRSWSI